MPPKVIEDYQSYRAANLHFQLGHHKSIFLDSLKKAMVILFQKSGQTANQISNYRPISLTDAMEKMIKKISRHLYQNQILITVFR